MSERIGKTEGEYSVVQFFSFEDKHEYVRAWVSLEEAVEAFRHYTTSLAVQFGLISRVIITDGGDCINAEWLYEQGIVFPPEMAIDNDESEPERE